MNGLRLGLFSPYMHSETTAAAIRVADVAGDAGCSVSWLSPSIHLPVHAGWDGKIRGYRHVRDWCLGSDVFVWFELPGIASLLRVRRHCRKTARHILVVSDVHPTFRSAAAFNLFDAVICPDVCVRDSLLGLGVIPARLTAIRWATGMFTRCRKQKLDGSVLVHCDNPTWRKDGMRTVLLADEMARGDVAGVTVAINGSPTRGQAKRLKHSISGRLKVVFRPPLDDLLVLLHRHDWLVRLDSKPCFGLLAAQARCCGVPTVAWNSMPASREITHGVDGLLVSPEGDLAYQRMAVACGDLKNRELLQHLRSGCYDRSVADEERHFWNFRQFWLSQLC